jgi:exonuclease III
VDICGFQETKCGELTDEQISDYRLILLPGKCCHYVRGFAVNKHWSDRLKNYESISDRIAVATFTLSPRTSMKVINIYAPTQARANKNEQERDQFYEQLERVLRKTPKQTTLFVLGDFNSKLGQDFTNTSCIGRFGRGRQNSNGQRLAEFNADHGLLATNTLFCHRASQPN